MLNRKKDEKMEKIRREKKKNTKKRGEEVKKDVLLNNRHCFPLEFLHQDLPMPTNYQTNNIHRPNVDLKACHLLLYLNR